LKISCMSYYERYAGIMTALSLLVRVENWGEVHI